MPSCLPLNLPEWEPWRLRYRSALPVLLVVLGSWGGVPVEDGAPPPMILDPEVLNILVLLYSIPPPSPIPLTTAHVPTPSLQMGGVFRVTPMPSTAVSPGMAKVDIPKVFCIF